jgi:hypothetical protein
LVYIMVSSISLPEVQMNTKLAAAILALLLLVACNGVSPVALETPTADVPISLVDTPTVVPATETPSPTPTVTATETPTSTPTSTPEPKGYGPNDFPKNINPLTGLEVSDPEKLDRRPVGVKINLVPRYNRPPWGLSSADIIYDFYHNDGYTRLHAIYYGEDAEMVGPIRSARLLDDVIVRIYKSIFAYGGADQLINNRLFNGSYANRLMVEGTRANCPPTEATPFCRFDPGRFDFLLVNTEAVTEYARSRGIENGRQNLDGMTFHPLIPEDGENGEQLFVRYSKDNYNRWDYDPASGRYLLYQDNLFLDQDQDEQFAPLTDRLNEEQIAVDNVVILLAPHEYFQRPPADIVEISLFGTGEAYAFRNGHMFRVTWNRPAADAMLYLTFEDGTNYPFKPGKTWFQVIGKYSDIKQIEGDAWRFEFRFQ